MSEPTFQFGIRKFSPVFPFILSLHLEKILLQILGLIWMEKGAWKCGPGAYQGDSTISSNIHCFDVLLVSYFLSA